MLTHDDAGVVKRDPAVPGLKLLFNRKAFTARLREALPGTEVKKVRAIYSRYKPQTSCLMTFQAKLNGTGTTLYAKALNPKAGEKLFKLDNRNAAPGVSGPSHVVFDDVAVAVYFFPNDRKLNALPLLADETKRGELFRTLLPNSPHYQEASIRMLNYKPERRFVAQAVFESGERAVIKLYAENEFPFADCGARAIKSAGRLRAPRRLKRSRRHRLLIFEWLRGEPLHRAWREPDFPLRKIRDVGAALAHLHAQKTDGLQRRTRETEAVATLAAAEACADVCPALGKFIRKLSLKLADELLKAPCQVCPIHGDFSADQVVLRNGNTGILDFDSAALGDPAADIGSFIAQLEYDQMKEGISGSRKNAVANAFVSGYLGSKCAESFLPIRLYTAVGLIRRAPHPFRNREPNWRRFIERLFERAGEIFNDPSHSP